MRISDWSSDVCSSDLLKGIDNLRYFSAQSSSAGRVTITHTFEQGTDPDIAQVQAQNKLQAATALPPQEVQRQGVTVAKSAASSLLITAIYSEAGTQPDHPTSANLLTHKPTPTSRL